jgi:hypothetical protein
MHFKENKKKHGFLMWRRMIKFLDPSATKLFQFQKSSIGAAITKLYTRIKMSLSLREATRR